MRLMLGKMNMLVLMGGYMENEEYDDEQPEGDFSHAGCSNGECGDC